MAELIGHRYNVAIRGMHWINLMSIFILIITGMRIYLGWGFPSSFAEARGLHMIAVITFLVANWILLPYGIFIEILERSKYAEMKCNFKDFRGIWLYIILNARYCKTEGIKRFLKTSLFFKEDANRLVGIIRHYMGKQEYPAFAVYNEKSGVYENRTHPVMKLLIPLESTAILFIVITGIVLYDINWSIFGINVGGIIMNMTAGAGVLFGINAMVLSRTLHLALTYFFIVEVLIHVGILQMDFKTKEAWKAIFINGKENIEESPYTTIKK